MNTRKSSPIATALAQGIVKDVPGKIVLVDNKKYEKDLLILALKQKNWNTHVEYFNKTEEAFEYLKNTKDDLFLIVSEINMHTMSGLDFKKALDRICVRKKTVPFIFVSGETSQEQIEEAYDYRVQGFFMKPESIEDQADMFDLIIKFWIISVRPAKLHLN